MECFSYKTAGHSYYVVVNTIACFGDDNVSQSRSPSEQRVKMEEVFQPPESRGPYKVRFGRTFQNMLAEDSFIATHLLEVCVPMFGIGSRGTWQ